MPAAELLHIDGSKHRWFSDGRYYDLLLILADATSEIYYAQLVQEESTRTVWPNRQPKKDGGLRKQRRYRECRLRVDTVRQGDLDGLTSVYHINALDEETQGQVAACAPHISEAWLQPVLEAMLKQFPFNVCGFHSDDGSEFVKPRWRNCLASF